MKTRSDNEAVHNKECLAMCRAHFNEPILNSGELVRCIGYGETGVDCYILARRLGTYAELGQRIWLTCVGGYTFLDRLKGQDYVRSSGGEDWDDFFRLDNLLQLNGAPKEPEFILDLQHDNMERSETVAAVGKALE